MKISLFVVLLGLGLGACLEKTETASPVSDILHDENSAAKVAAAFVDALAVKRNPNAAWGLLAVGTQAELPPPKLAEILRNMHPKGYPGRVQASQFEPLPGQKRMNVYVDGTGEDGFSYQVVLEGDSGAGYRVLAIHRSEGGPFPPSKSKHPLKGGAAGGGRKAGLSGK